MSFQGMCSGTDLCRVVVCCHNVDRCSDQVVLDVEVIVAEHLTGFIKNAINTGFALVSCSLLASASTNAQSVVCLLGNVYNSLCSAIHSTAWRPSSSTTDIGGPDVAIELQMAFVRSLCVCAHTGLSLLRRNCRWLKCKSEGPGTH